MFTDIVSSTPFVSEDANYLFRDKIPYVHVMNDVSLVSTMRAIIAPRMAEGEHLNICPITFSGVYTDLNSIISSDYTDASDYFLLVNLSNTDTSKREHAFECVRENFVAERAGYEELEMVEGFFAKSFPMLCFVNREIKTSVVFVQRLDFKKLHYLQTALLVMMPWYHGPRESVSDNELALIKSLKEKTQVEYIKYLNELIKNSDIRGARIRRLMTGFETRADEERVRRVEEDIAAQNRYIREYDEYIATALRQKNELLVTLMGLKEKISEMESTDSDLMGYLLRNKRISLHDTYGSTVTFIASDYISFFDEDMVERCISNRRSYVYYEAPDNESGERMAKLLQKIFLDGELKLKVCAAYQMTAGERVQGISGFGFDSQYENCMPNPHIQYYACLGNYERILNRLIGDNDYIGVIDQCIASVKSLNWGDSTVMAMFMRAMYNDDCRCIELPNGTMCYPSEAIEWINEQESRLSRSDELRAICFEEDEDDEEAEENEEE